MAFAVDTKPPIVALVPSPFQRRKAPRVENSPSLSRAVLTDADAEAIRWLGDVGFEVEYSGWAAKGMSIQNFLRTRQLAMQDLFEDIEEEAKLGLQQPGVSLEDLRAQPEYAEIREALLKAADALRDGSITAARWVEKRAGAKARRHLERAMRTTDGEMGRDALRAASAVVEMETPKASRIPPTKKVIQFPEEAAKTVATAFGEAGIKVVGPIEIGDGNDSTA